MTRKEEIEQKAFEAAMQHGFNAPSYEAGAAWADATAWKPSIEQIEILEKVCNTVALTKKGNEVLESLYNDLKKLKGE